MVKEKLGSYYADQFLLVVCKLMTPKNSEEQAILVAMNIMKYSRGQRGGQDMGRSENSRTLDLASRDGKVSNRDTEVVDHLCGSNNAPRDVHGLVWTLVVVATISSMFLFGLDQTITADVQPAVTERFNSIAKLPWISVGLLLGASASNLFWGQVYANYNIKWAYVFCFIIFELGSALCAAAPTIDVFIAGRTLAGFGGTGMYNGVVGIFWLNQ